MKPHDFIEGVKLFENKDELGILSRLNNKDMIRLFHSALGLSTESGEFVDTIKKYIFYGKDIDKVNLVEELGDILWYVSLTCIDLNVSLEDVMGKCFNKLKSRYGDSWNKESALNRNHENERKIIEGGFNE